MIPRSNYITCRDERQLNDAVSSLLAHRWVGLSQNWSIFFNKGRDRKEGWDCVIRGGGGGGFGVGGENLQNSFNLFKGNPNFQGILN